MSYQTVRELHIAIDQELQYIDSNRKNSITSEQKDWFLNSCQLRLIKQKINALNPIQQGTEEVIKRYEDLLPIKTPLVDLSVYYNDNESVYALLPSNCLQLITDISYVINDCNNLISVTPTVETITYGVIPFVNSNAVGIKYSDLELEINGVTTIYDWSSIGLNIYSGDSKYRIIDDIIYTINTTRTDMEIYWEYYNNLYYKNSFIIIKKNNSLNNLSLDYDGILVSTVFGTTIQRTRKVYTQDVNKIENRLTKSEHKYLMLNSHYRTTRYNSPISSLENRNMLRVYHKNKFKINGIGIEYYKFPRKIDYNLNYSCELTNLTEELVALVVQEIKAYLNDPAYNLTERQNVKIV